MKEESPAAGIVPPLSRLYMVDAVDVGGATKAAAMEALKNTNDTLTFVISQEPDVDGYNAFKNPSAPGEGGAPPAPAAAEPSAPKQAASHAQKKPMPSMPAPSASLLPPVEPERAILRLDQVRVTDQKLPPYWVVAYVGDREKYYFNTATNETSWSVPEFVDDDLDDLGDLEWDDSHLKNPTVFNDFATNLYNNKHAQYRIKVMPQQGTAYTILGGMCHFGGEVATEGLTAPLHYDVFNPTASKAFDTSTLELAEAIRGSVVLVERGDVVIADKIHRCQEAGAVGCIIASVDEEGRLFDVTKPGDGTEDGILVPATSVAFENGLDLITSLQDGVAVLVELNDTRDVAKPRETFLPGDMPLNDAGDIKISDIGLVCEVAGKGRGALAFVGYTEGGTMEVGVVLDDRIGEHHGKVEGAEYFVCKNGHGIMCDPRDVTVMTLEEEKKRGQLRREAQARAADEKRAKEEEARTRAEEESRRLEVEKEKRAGELRDAERLRQEALDAADDTPWLMSLGGSRTAAGSVNKRDVQVHRGNGKLGMSIAGPRDEADPRKG